LGIHRHEGYIEALVGSDYNRGSVT
jgi:hypothetical protein